MGWSWGPIDSDGDGDDGGGKVGSSGYGGGGGGGGKDESSEENKKDDQRRSDIPIQININNPAAVDVGPSIPNPGREGIPSGPEGGAGQRSFQSRFGRPSISPPRDWDEEDDDGEALVEVDHEDDDYLEQPAQFYSTYY